MKIFLTASIAAALLVFQSLDANAAEGNEKDVYEGWIKPGPPPVERFVTPLGLTAEQHQKLKPIFAEAQAKAAADDELSKTNAATPEASPENFAIREADLRVRLATVLSPDQLATYEKLTSAHSANAPKQHSQPAHGHSDMNSAKPEDATVEPLTRPAAP